MGHANKYLLMTVLAAGLALPAFADIAADLENTFNKLNADVNVNRPMAFNDQRGGYYSGGSIYARFPVKNTHIANIQMPSFSAGCGGIDLFAGGMSYIKAKELVNNLKAAIPAAAGYAFSLAMQTMTPQLYNVLTELQDWAQKINSLNINSCEIAAMGVGGIWPQSDTSSKYLCNVMGASNGAVSDWVNARQKCGQDETRGEINKDKKPGFEDQLGDEFNLVWKAIRRNGFLSEKKNKRLAEFFMSVSGTIVHKKGENKKVGDKTIRQPGRAPHYPSLITQNDLITMLIHGKGKAKIYSCQDEKECLTIAKTDLSIKPVESLWNKVDALLVSMSNKVLTDGKATAEEMGLVNSTHIPIMKILTIESAYKRGGAPMSLVNFTEAISYDVLLNYLDSILNLVAVSLKELEEVQIDGAVIDSFQTQIRDARRIILEKRNGVFQHMVTALNAAESTMKLEKELINIFDSHTQLSS